MAFCELAGGRTKEDLLSLFTITQVAYHGDKKAVKDLLKGLGRRG